MAAVGSHGAIGDDIKAQLALGRFDMAVSFIGGSLRTRGTSALTEPRDMLQCLLEYADALAHFFYLTR